MTKTYKTCNCCGQKTYNLKRYYCNKCSTDGRNPQWTRHVETQVEVKDREADNARLQRIMDTLMQ